MQRTICSRCKKNIAVIFITKIENGQSTNEGLCLKCAKELKIKPVEDIIRKMGLSDDDLDNLSSEMVEAMNGIEALTEIEDGDNDEDGKTATFPFLNKLFGNQGGQAEENAPEQEPHTHTAPKEKDAKKKNKYLDDYCINLTDRAREGKLDAVIGRETETERVIQILNTIPDFTQHVDQFFSGNDLHMREVPLPCRMIIHKLEQILSFPNIRPGIIIYAGIKILKCHSTSSILLHSV